METNISDDAIKVLQLLKDRHNVLISGAPGTGKSRLLSEVANAFINSAAIASEPTETPVHIPGASVPIPNEIPAEVNTELQELLPSPSRTNRKIFRTVFHQNSKYRDFISGLTPITGNQGGFKVIQGTLYRASEHGKSTNGASLLIIDEINRGPAVQVFGGSIVAIEPDKRLSDDSTPHPETQYFEILDPETGDVSEYALPTHLYILAAMNQADTSVEPLDVAFLRRWAPFYIKPDDQILRTHFELNPDKKLDIPEAPSDTEHVYELAVQAWEIVNKRIRIGRGSEFQIGHGIFLVGNKEPANNLDESLIFIAEVWNYIKSHIEEVFFGDIRGVAAVLNIIGGSDDHPYKLNETTFADEPRIELIGPNEINTDNVYQLLRAIIN